MDNLGEFKYNIFTLNKNNPITVPKGHYLLIFSHSGFGCMAQVAFVNLTGYEEDSTQGHKNTFYKAVNLFSNKGDGNNDTYYTVYFNPVTCQIKLNLPIEEESRNLVLYNLTAK